ncbi:hypothetical protein [Candidatus Albibeggiatoa sp. nov. NOAA]|uniref:hypothetical protein n=1 Tax=Candidatus Albibeggiatoa sp. nov. NOAA TaxID=3162724 RepID=UPI0032F1E6CE|nr:hypothetical protein [Thiotrichaceae bacterium]
MKNLQLTLFASVIGLITLLMYWQGLYYDYVQWDEGSYIVQNPHIQSFSLDNLYWMLTAIHAAVWAPILWFSYAIDYQISGLNPFAYHLSNIVLHAFNSIWIFFLTLLILKIRPIATFSEKQRYLAAGIAAILFVIHPQHVEPVMWIASRKDVLSLFFILATVWFYLHYTQSNAKTYYWLAVISFALAAATKPVAMTIPIVLLMLDIFLLQRIQSIKQLFYLAIFEKWPFWFFAILTAGMVFYAHLLDDRIISTTTISMDIRIFNAAEMILFYLGKFIIPLGLSPYYPFSINASFYPIIILALLTGLLFYLYLQYKQSAIWVTWLIFLVSLFPMLNIVTFNPELAGADKFVYLPMVGFYILLGIGIIKGCIHCSEKWQFIAKISLFLIMVGFIQLSQQQMTVWKDNLHLWQAANQAYPNHIEIQDSLATAYAEHGQYQAAIHYYQQNAQQTENCIRCDYGLANSYLQLGELHKALFYLQKILQNIDKSRQHGLDDVYFKIALIKGQLGDFPAALEAAEKGIKINPNNQQGQQLKQQLQHYYHLSQQQNN